MSEAELLHSEPEMPTLPPSEPTGRRSNSDSTEDHSAMFDRLSQMLDRKLANFKRSFDEREEEHTSQLKKLKTESKATNSFKFKGNKVQFEFNSSILDGLETIHKDLVDGNLTKADAEIEKLKSTVNKRNKLIRFADKSPAGWTAVEEYESDELAENSDDEKKLRSAEKRAMTKLKTKKQPPKATFKAFNRNLAQHDNDQRQYSPNYRQNQPFRAFGRYNRRQPTPSDKCFACGQRGHWAGDTACQNKYRHDFRGYGASGASTSSSGSTA